jgi:hypothetical protein
MQVAEIFQVILFAALALMLLVIVAGALNAVIKPRKGKSYRYSKKGDAWIQKYKS